MKCTLVTFVLQGFVMAGVLEGSCTNNRTGNYSIKYPIRPPWCSPSSSFLSDLPEACEKVGRGGWGGSRSRFCRDASWPGHLAGRTAWRTVITPCGSLRMSGIVPLNVCINIKPWTTYLYPHKKIQDKKMLFLDLNRKREEEAVEINKGNV